LTWPIFSADVVLNCRHTVSSGRLDLPQPSWQCRVTILPSSQFRRGGLCWVCGSLGCWLAHCGHNKTPGGHSARRSRRSRRRPDSVKVLRDPDDEPC